MQLLGNSYDSFEALWKSLNAVNSFLFYFFEITAETQFFSVWLLSYIFEMPNS